MTNKYTLLFKKIDDDVITLTRKTLYNICYVNKHEIEIKNRPVFVFFFKTQQFMIYRIVALLLPLTV
jgi:hypothetical protein